MLKSVAGPTLSRPAGNRKVENPSVKAFFKHFLLGGPTKTPFREIVKLGNPSVKAFSMCFFVGGEHKTPNTWALACPVYSAPAWPPQNLRNYDKEHTCPVSCTRGVGRRQSEATETN